MRQTVVRYVFRRKRSKPLVRHEGGLTLFGRHFGGRKVEVTHRWFVSLACRHVAEMTGPTVAKSRDAWICYRHFEDGTATHEVRWSAWGQYSTPEIATV